jgi:hypothetical protein
MTGSAHVAVSLGNGSTIEARRRDSGVGRFGARGRCYARRADPRRSLRDARGFAR